jgi:hypothetical protein
VKHTAQTFIAAANAAFVKFNCRQEALKISRETKQPLEENSDTLAFLMVFNEVQTRFNALMRLVRETVEYEFAHNYHPFSHNFLINMYVYDYRKQREVPFDLELKFTYNAEQCPVATISVTH